MKHLGTNKKIETITKEEILLHNKYTENVFSLGTKGRGNIRAPPFIHETSNDFKIRLSAYKDTLK